MGNSNLPLVGALVAAGCAVVVLLGSVAAGAMFFVFQTSDIESEPVAYPTPMPPTMPPPLPTPMPTPPPAVASAVPAGVARRVPVEGAPMQGPRDALVTIVVFSDFECPFCGRVVPTLAQVRETYGADVRIAFRHNPLPFHSRATPAAAAAISVFQQRGDDAFFQMHDLLFENRSALSDADLMRYAAQVGASAPTVGAALGSGQHADLIRADQQLAASLGARGTPAFFINGQQLMGAQPFPAFARVIDAELATARAMVAAGTPRAAVYDQIMASAQ